VWIVRHDDLAQWVLDNNIREWTNGERFYPQEATRRGKGKLPPAHE
jgi:hypothetical protein